MSFGPPTTDFYFPAEAKNLGSQPPSSITNRGILEKD